MGCGVEGLGFSEFGVVLEALKYMGLLLSLS